jgi:beta-lactamase regulating signal transducer with metallopeptidase domain
MTGAIETLLNGMWQSALVALATAAVLKRTGGLNAATRYWIWYAVLLAAAGLSVHPVPPWWKAAAVGAALPDRAAATSETPPQRAGAVSGEAPVSLPIAPFAGWLCALWTAAGTMALARLVRDYLRLSRLKGMASTSAAVSRERLAQWQDAAGGKRRARLLDSAGIQLPAAAGLWRPAVLFPSGLKLSQAEAFQIWMHEASHFRRWDDWTNLAQRILEAIFCFHPVVRWAGRRLDFEREIACDDFVCASGADPRPYAACLVRLASLRALSPAAALGAAPHRKQIFRRMEMILNRRRNTNPLPAPRAVLLALALVLGAASAVSRVRPVLALAVPDAAADVSSGNPKAPRAAVAGAPGFAARGEAPPAAAGGEEALTGALPPAPSAAAGGEEALAGALPAPPAAALAQAPPAGALPPAPARAQEPPPAPEPPRPRVRGEGWTSRRIEEMTRRLEQAGEEFRGRSEKTLREFGERIERLRVQAPDEQLIRELERQMREAAESLRWVEREFERQGREWERALRNVERDIGGLEREDGEALPPPAPPAPAASPRPAPRAAPPASPTFPRTAPAPAAPAPAPAGLPAIPPAPGLAAPAGIPAPPPAPGLAAPAGIPAPPPAPAPAPAGIPAPPPAPGLAAPAGLPALPPAPGLAAPGARPAPRIPPAPPLARPDEEI